MASPYIIINDTVYLKKIHDTLLLHITFFLILMECSFYTLAWIHFLMPGQLPHASLYTWESPVSPWEAWCMLIMLV